MKNGYDKFFGKKETSKRQHVMTKSDVVMFDHMVERLATAEMIIKEAVQFGIVTDKMKKYADEFCIKKDKK